MLAGDNGAGGEHVLSALATSGQAERIGLVLDFFVANYNNINFIFGQ